VALDIPAERLRVVDAQGSAVDEGVPAFFVGLGQPDARTEALTGKKSIRI
jgi:hypothetical protein